MSNWASAVRSAIDAGYDCTIDAGYLGREENEAKVCGGYEVLSFRGTDTGEDAYYDKTSGMLVAIVSVSANCGCQSCVGGPANFVPPSTCSPSMSLCDLAADGGGDGGTDALSNAADSAPE